MKFVVDRIEENYVVCEECNSGEMINIEKECFPSDIKSGTTFELLDGVITVLQNDETHERIKSKMNSLWK